MAKRLSQAGMTILEVMIVGTILAIFASAIMGFLLGTLKIETRNRDRAFALEKCNQIIEEITAYSLSGEDVIELDRFKDLVPQSILTADTTISSPNHPLSGNKQNRFGNWNFVRTVDVLPISNEPRARIVSVKVYYQDNDKPGEAGLLLAQLTKLLKTAGDVFPPTQVFDVYAIAIENTPGWWVDMSVMKPMMYSAMNSIQARNPGLQFRVHWITRNGFGRDPYYLPFFNDANDATDAGALPYCYVYPSAIFKSDDFYYYPPHEVAGNKNVDNTVIVDSVFSYPLADYFNHAVRYPEEVKRYEQMVSAYESRGYEPPEPSLAQLWQDLFDNPGKYTNSLFFNLHGELIPLPPVRNYSDPAKSPANYRHLRVVSHPEKLRYNSWEDPKLRVYAYYTFPDSFSGSSSVDTICVFFPGLTIDESYFNIRYMQGCDTIGYCWNDATSGYQYSYSSRVIKGRSGTLLELYKTPARSPWNPTSGSATVLQAEDGTMIGSARALREGTSNPPVYTGYRGTGYVERLTSSGRGVYWPYSPDSTGTYDITVRYANQNSSTCRWSFQKRIGSTWYQVGYFYFPSTGSWSNWSEITISASLEASVNQVRLYWGSGDGSSVLLDEITIAPPVDMSFAYDQTRPIQCQGTYPSSFTFTFTGCPTNVGTDGFLYVYGIGDIDGTNEFYRVYGEGSYYEGNVFTSSGYTQCSATYEEDQITIPQSRLRTYASDGNITFTLTADPEINWCTDNCLYVRLVYDTSDVNLGGPGGLAANKRLYGLEYIPCPVTSSNDFSRDLADPSEANVKNTARWTIEIDSAGLPDTTMITFWTWIGRRDNCAIPACNFSETYFWRSTNPPIIEQQQILGDPRHVPYADTKANHYYNWYFIINNPTDYSGFSALFNDLWGGEGRNIDVDVPKAFMWIRHGLTMSNAFWNSMTGYSNYYVGLGQEIGGDADNHPEYDKGIPLHAAAWKTDPSPSNKIDEITSAYERQTLPSTRSEDWSCFPWLGELFPDTDWSSWQSGGNLSVSNYYRVRFSNANWKGDNSTNRDRIKRTSGKGCISFNNAVPAGDAPSVSRTFSHTYQDFSAKSNITAEGESLAARFKLPLTNKMSSGRPFKTKNNAPPHGFSDEWGNTFYQNKRFQMEEGTTFYTFPNEQISSSIVVLHPPSSETELTGNAARMLYNGLSPSKDQGASWIVIYGLASLTQALMDEGHPSKPSSSRVRQVPRLEITAPEPNAAVPLSFDLEWDTAWRRWDGLTYSWTYPAGFAETTPLFYAVKYSPDGGRNWFYASDNSPAKTGVRPDASHSTTSKSQSITFTTEGAYIIRVECFRQYILTHYSYHQIRVLVLTNV